MLNGCVALAAKIPQISMVAASVQAGLVHPDEVVVIVNLIDMSHEKRAA
jgi:hypothetical protein